MKIVKGIFVDSFSHNEKTFDSPDELINFINSELLEDSDLYFRGQSDNSWKLETTLKRFIKNEQARSSGHKVRESMIGELLIDTFQRNLRITKSLPVETIHSMKESELWQFAQHYGLPSPYLDWSASPFVALFFALSQNIGNGITPCIWMLNRMGLSTLQHETGLTEDEPDFTNGVFLVEPVHGYNHRIGLQQGFFTRGPDFLDHDEWQNTILRHRDLTITPMAFEKISFKCSEQQRIATLRKLEKMNICYRNLYPDIEGVAKDAMINYYPHNKRAIKTAAVKRNLEATAISKIKRNTST